VTDAADLRSVSLDSIDYIVRQIRASYSYSSRCLSEFSLCVTSQDHPTIKFNAKESVEMPFREFVFSQMGSY
jgi:hypothetical protein